MEEEIKKQTELLKEILKWTKIQGIDRIKQVMINEFSDEKKKLVYDNSNGISSDDIEKLLNGKVSDMSVRNWWKGWARMGLMELHPNYKKRYIKIFNLEDFGIDVPDLKISNKRDILEVSKSDKTVVSDNT
jgi:hypothetical protein